MTLYERMLAEERHGEAVWNSLYQPLHYSAKFVRIDRPRRLFGKCAVRVEPPKASAPMTGDEALLAVQLASRGFRRGS